MSQPIVPEDPPVLPGDFERVVKVRSEHTNGVMAVIEETIQPGRLVSPHTHENDVWVYVLTGEIGVLVGDTMAIAGQGSWALKPRNVVHAIWNSASVAAQVVEVDTRRLRAVVRRAGEAGIWRYGRVRRRVPSVRHSLLARLALDGRAP
jgi:quercetin dioxygenase-like cupin family protein